MSLSQNVKFVGIMQVELPLLCRYFDLFAWSSLSNDATGSHDSISTKSLSDAIHLLREL